MYNFQFIFYFSLAFFITKNTASFPFFIVSHPLTHLILFLVCFFFFGENFQLWSPSRDSRYSNKVRKPAKTWLRRGPDPELFTEHTGRWGFVVCVCFVYGLWFLFVCLFVCLSVCCFFTSLYICNIFVIYNIYTWFLFLSRTFFVIYSVPVISSCISLKSYVFSQFVNVCLAVTCLLCYNICCCLIK